ncbi:aminotransferase class V-fold PLP-dependent enzyme [Cryobacterium sp. PAMC25264]|uniref:aminotransferase class V-fold PLP-dependent enzyme n=1 Tax=Cryobacterium sp. PAMC25264 TaxID=2861288 RepID=UPI001C63135F|nr:aminotransferase class V-fold PLP-dependent enzyme [Cryobacterium sp. PAMC25264]QYF72144.1 aminotransferase class V-fold PLP-dependent enzyme [Cryobacterium sp. PAMC25264]
MKSAEPALTAYLDGFTEDPGYLDYGRIGPLSRAVLAESLGQGEILARARYGSLGHFGEQDLRMRAAVAALTRFRADQVVAQPNTSMGLMHAMFGLTGDVLLSPADFPSLPFAARRAAEALHVATPLWLEAETTSERAGQVTPGQVRDQLTPGTVAVAVSLVDSRTGFRTDLEGIRQVIGDRLLIVDAIQGFGVVDAAYEVADVVASGGQKWARAGWGTGFLALSDRAVERLTPVMSGFTGTVPAGSEELPWDDVPPPVRAAAAFGVTNADGIAQARLASALEEIQAVGVDVIESAVAANTERLIDLADEFGIGVSSSRDARERAGMVVLQPPAERLTALGAALHNHGLTTTVRSGSVRLSAHARLAEETMDMLRAAFVAYTAAERY